MMRKYADYNAWLDHIAKVGGVLYTVDSVTDKRWSPIFKYIEQGRLSEKDYWQLNCYVHHIPTTELQKCLADLETLGSGYATYRRSIIRRFGEYSYEWENTKIHKAMKMYLQWQRYEIWGIEYVRRDIDLINAELLNTIYDVYTQIPDFFQFYSRDALLAYFEERREYWRQFMKERAA